MEQTTLVTGVIAMAAGAALFSIGMYGWRPAAEKAGGCFETPAALAGALVWLVRLALRSSGAARPRVPAGRGLDITPQCAAPLRGTAAASYAARASSPAASRPATAASKRSPSRKRIGKGIRRTAKARTGGAGSPSAG